jgi:hypothetical protein
MPLNFADELERLRGIQKYMQSGSRKKASKDIGLSIADFKENLKDVARPNRFQMYFLVNASLTANRVLLDDTKWQVKGLNLPGRTISEYDVKHLGLTRKMPGEPTYENMTVNFWSEYSWNLRGALEEWMESMASMNDNQREDSSVILTSSAVIEQLGRQGETLASYTLHEIFPTVLGNIDLSHDTNDAPEEFTCEFSFANWSPGGGS